MKKKIPQLLLLIGLFVAGCSTDPGSKPGKAGNIAALDSLIVESVHLEQIPGAVLRVQKGDSILHNKAYGYARIIDYELQALEKPQEMTVEHIFDLASLTKVFATTYGMMLLIDKGMVDPDDPVYLYLSEFGEGEKRNITIRNLLTHSSGLAQWYPLYYEASNRQERYQATARMPLKWPIGDGRHYSDLGFMLLGDIIERVSGESLDQFLANELYGPLSLQRTTFNPLQKGFETIAATSHGNPFEKHMVYDDNFGYTVDVDPESWDNWREYTLLGEVNDGNAWYANKGVAGHAGLFSTAQELQVLINVLLNKGMHENKRIISEAVIDTFLNKDNYGNGLGWAMDPDVISAEGTPKGTFGHTGFTGTNVVVIPKYDMSVIFLTNRQHVGLKQDGYYYNLNGLRQKIVDILLKRVQ